MSMLITERTPITPRKTARVQFVAPTQPRTITKVDRPRVERVVVAPSVITAKPISVFAKLGDRQSWLLLTLMLIPVAGMIYNFATYGFNR